MKCSSPMLLALILLCILLSSTVIQSVSAAKAEETKEDKEVKTLLTAGDKLLMKGRNSYQDAIAKYTQAINIQPENVKAVYRRAELFSMMKNHDKMSEDLKQVLKIDPSHRQGLVLRSKYLASIGKFLEAAHDYNLLVGIFNDNKKVPKAVEAQKNAGELNRIGNEWRNIEHHLGNKDLTLEQRIGVNQQCCQVLENAIAQFAKDNVALRLKRAECGLGARNQVVISEEVKYILKRDPGNLRAVALGARAFRALGAVEQARSEVRRCLNLDQEYSECRKLHKAIKAHEKQKNIIEALVSDKNWKNVIAEVDVAITMEDDPPNIDQLYKWKCEGFKELRDVDAGIAACTTYLAYDTSSLDGILWRADIHIMNDDLAKAQEDVTKANDVHNNNERVREYQQKLEKLKQMKDRKDYYKILGVKKTANDQEIRRAFRKLAMHLHPDQLRSKDQSEEEKEKNDALFRDINEAKEMLLDSEKRQRYDNGEDVTKPPEQQQHHHGFPGGFPGGGGGGFNFHFG